MDKKEEQKTINELNIFYKKLRSYQNRQHRRIKGDTSVAKDRSLNALRLELQREYGRLSYAFYEHKDTAIIPHSEDSRIVFNAALSSLNMDDNAFTGLDIAINIVITTIGKFEQTSLVSNELKKTAVLKDQRDTLKLPGSFFDKMQFHPKVIQASKSLYISGHHSQAIFEAFKAVNNYVKDKTGLTLDGTNLMDKVFQENRPILKVNELLTQTDRNEQAGFKHIFMGCQLGIRNPSAHDNSEQGDLKIALEYLSLASLLMRKIDKSKLVKLNIKELKVDQSEPT